MLKEKIVCVSDTEFKCYTFDIEIKEYDEELATLHEQYGKHEVTPITEDNVIGVCPCCGTWMYRENSGKPFEEKLDFHKLIGEYSGIDAALIIKDLFNKRNGMVFAKWILAQKVTAKQLNALTPTARETYMRQYKWLTKYVKSGGKI